MYRLTPKNFATDPDKLLWLGLAARDGGSRASALIGITDPVVALDLDLAVTLRLVEHDNDKRRAEFEALASMFGAE